MTGSDENRNSGQGGAASVEYGEATTLTMAWGLPLARANRAEASEGENRCGCVFISIRVSTCPWRDRVGKRFTVVPIFVL